MENQPRPTDEVPNSQKPFYKEWWGVILILMFLPIFATWYIWAKTKWSKVSKSAATFGVVCLTLFMIGSNSSKEQSSAQSSSNNPQPQQQASAPVAQQPNNNPPAQVAETPVQNTAPALPATPTDQASLEKYLTSIISSASPDMSLKDMSVDKSDPDRPAGTQMVGINITVNNFSNTDAILKTTEKLTSSICQTVFNIPKIKAYDVIVFYDTGMNNAVADRYGNKQSGGISYSIDKPTYDKINWQSFDQTTLCDVLTQENKVTNQDSAGCHMLGNAQ